MRFLTRRLAVMFAAFVMLGLPEGVLGTAWPSIRLSFDRPEAALAQLIIGYTAGYLISSVLAGRVTERFGGSRSTRIGVSLTALGLVGYAVTPVWLLALAAAVCLGTGGGFVDVGVNTEVALRHGQRAMNMLHAAFGVGATLGPLAVTALLAFEGSWRLAYAALFIIELAVLAGLVTSHRADRRREPTAPDTTTYAAPSSRPQLTLLATLVLFAFYVGSEVSVGQWTFSILTEERDVSTTAAGIAVGSYWGGLTIGRLALGLLDRRVQPLRLMRVSVVVAVLAATWLWIGGTGSLLALPALGLALSGMFPAAVMLSSSWLGAERLGRAVGYQLAASSAGAILASAVLGVVADRSGLGAVAGAIVVLVVGLVAAQVALEATVR